MKSIQLVAVLSLLISCSDTKTNIDNKEVVSDVKKGFESVPSSQTGISFTNTITETEEFSAINYEYMYNGGGVAVGDINNDGLTDIYFTGNQVSDKLYLNKGNMVFEDITAIAIDKKSSEGWHTGVSMVDVNQDGWLDIYVCRSGIPKDIDERSNLLYINNKDNTFTEKGEEYGVASNRKTTQATFFDYDNDGDLDLYILNHVTKNLSGKKFSVGEIKDLIRAGSPESDQFFKNENGLYIDVTKEVGFSNHAHGLGITVSDINNDGYQDLYISNDFLAPDNLYMNNGDGTFTDKAREQLKHMSTYSMGNDIADFNNDGLLDIFSADMVSEDHIRSKKNMGGMNTQKFWDIVGVGYHYQYMFNALQMNNGNETFSDVAQICGVSKTDWSWAPLFVDFDNDGNKDLFISNGYRRDMRDNDFLKKSNTQEVMESDFQAKLDIMPVTVIQNYIFKNNGDLEFKKKMKDWNLNAPTNSNGAAYADFDNDGDIDLVINNMDKVSEVLRNDLKTNNNYIRIKLKKNGVSYLGAKVKILHNDKTYYQELQTVRGFQSSVEDILHFGLGDMSEIEQLEIIWPNKSVTLKTNIEVNKLYVFEYNNEEKSTRNLQVNKSSLFTQVHKEIYTHKELFVNDFEKEILLPNKMSQLGPFMSSGDVNNDGLDDIYISGSRTFSGQLLLQNKNGEFTKSSGPWENQTQREEMDSEFFDVDNDGDLDLYVVSGSNEYDINSKNLNDQLYINDGKGHFKNESFRLPPMKTSGQRLTVGDIDNDGDLDIFIGGRQTPGFYPFAPRSYLLQNNDGYFTDITQNSNDIMGPGLITQSIFDDFDQDGDLDLICVGEWMPISFFENNNGFFTNVTFKYGNPKAIGWWSSITKGDYNGDGKNDYIVGNLGMNNKFHPTMKHPLEVYCHDFDNSGTYDIVLGKYQNETCYPVRGKQCSSEQMPFVSNKFPTYDAFAVANLESIYGKTQLDKALHYSATTFKSVILLSQSKGYLEQSLNSYAQISCINSGVAADINNDGFIDFIGVGNNYATEVETIRYDAGVGVVLLGDGKGKFRALRPSESNFFSNTDDKDIIKINNTIFISSNNSKVKQFKFNKR